MRINGCSVLEYIPRLKKNLYKELKSKLALLPGEQQFVGPNNESEVENYPNISEFGVRTQPIHRTHNLDQRFNLDDTRLGESELSHLTLATNSSLSTSTGRIRSRSMSGFLNRRNLEYPNETGNDTGDDGTVMEIQDQSSDEDLISFAEPIKSGNVSMNSSSGLGSSQNSSILSISVGSDLGIPNLNSTPQHIPIILIDDASDNDSDVEEAQTVQEVGTLDAAILELAAVFNSQVVGLEIDTVGDGNSVDGNSVDGNNVDGNSVDGEDTVEEEEEEPSEAESWIRSAEDADREDGEGGDSEYKDMELILKYYLFQVHLFEGILMVP